VRDPWPIAAALLWTNHLRLSDHETWPGALMGAERTVTALPADAQVMRLTAAARRAVLPPCGPLSQKNDLDGLIWLLSAPAPWLGPLVSAKA
jgi:hypothetical protein